MKNLLMAFTVLFTVSTFLQAQKITYAKANAKDNEMEESEVVGNYNNNILIYKKLHTQTIISVYDEEMNERSRNDLDIPPNKIIKTDFITYPQFSYMVYQYLTKKIVFCMAAKLGSDGKIIGKPIQLDYYEIKSEKQKRLYQVLPYNILTSEDKKRIMVLKASKIEGEKFIFKTSLFNENLIPQHVGQSELPIIDSLQKITEFALGNDGELVFLSSVTSTLNNNNSIHYFLVEKPALKNSIITDTIKIDSLALKNLKLTLDNVKLRCILTSFYYDKQTKNIEGLCNMIWDRQLHKQVINHVIPLDDKIRTEAVGTSKMKLTAFNDFYLQTILFNKDGSFLITAESQYIVLGNPPIAPLEQQMFAPQPINNQINADDVMVLWFDMNGNLQKSNIINKSQYTYNPVAGVISYALINSGDNLYFLYNAFGKIKALLPTCQTLSLYQQMGLPKQLLGFDGNYLLLPGLAKQTGLHQTVIPCISKTFYTFSKVDF